METLTDTNGVERKGIEVRSGDRWYPVTKFTVTEIAESFYPVGRFFKTVRDLMLAGV